MSDVLVNNAHVATQPDSGDTTKYGPDAHNASRLFSGGAPGNLPYRDPGSATGSSWFDGVVVDGDTGRVVWGTEHFPISSGQTYSFYGRDGDINVAVFQRNDPGEARCCLVSSGVEGATTP